MVTAQYREREAVPPVSPAPCVLPTYRSHLCVIEHREGLLRLLGDCGDANVERSLYLPCDQLVKTRASLDITGTKVLFDFVAKVQVIVFDGFLAQIVVYRAHEELVDEGVLVILVLIICTIRGRLLKPLPWRIPHRRRGGKTRPWC